MITRFLNKISSNHLLPSLGRGMGVGLMAFFGLFATTSCEDMLMTENDSMVIDPGLDNKTDSVFYALGIAQTMQQVADQYFFVGEMKGDMVTTTAHTDNDLRQLADYSATAANEYNSAYLYYQVINNCNYYLAHRDTSLYIGSTNVSINEYAAVAAWRAWAYLQLARTYGGEETPIPFYTEPLTAISQIREENFPKLTLSQIVAELAPQLEQFSGLDVPRFSNGLVSVGTTNWGNAKSIEPSKLFVPVDVILGEMYLEASQYDKAAEHYAKYLCDNKLLATNLGAGFRSQLVNSPQDYIGAFNTAFSVYNAVFTTSDAEEIRTYIPMAVSQENGHITAIPNAFGYDYYSTDRANTCPRVENIQLAPSATFYALTDTAEIYYYPNLTATGSPDTVKIWKAGDARANVRNEALGMGSRDGGILNLDATDTTKVYISKMRNANVFLFRTSTIYLHLAEALNRMGHYDAAFAILRNGISTYLTELVPGAGGVFAKHQYMKQESVDLLAGRLLFLNTENSNYFLPEETYGIHHHGTSIFNTMGLENATSVAGSLATAVGSKNNHHYLPANIIGMKMEELRNRGYAVGTEVEDTINAMELVLCDEYAKEFAFEGVRFYDLQRMARHLNENAFEGSRWFAEKLQGNNPQKNLAEPKNWYLPFK